MRLTNKTSVIFSFILLAIILSSSFVSAGLCKGRNGYYRDCDDFEYNRNKYNEYGRHVGHYEYDEDYKLKYGGDGLRKIGGYKKGVRTIKLTYDYSRRNFDDVKRFDDVDRFYMFRDSNKVNRFEKFGNWDKKKYGYENNKYWNFRKRDSSNWENEKSYVNWKMDSHGGDYYKLRYSWEG